MLYTFIFLSCHKMMHKYYVYDLGCDCNYSLCKTQRNGHYHTWKWFDYCLWLAIYELSFVERGSFSVFSGLNGVKMDKKSVKEGYFVTYVSSSWRKEVCKAFMNGDGMIIETSGGARFARHVLFKLGKVS